LILPNQGISLRINEIYRSHTVIYRFRNIVHDLNRRTFWIFNCTES